MRQTSIRSKLLVALAVPVLVVALLTASQVARAQSELTSTRNEVKLALAAGGPTTLITSLLDERNISAIDMLGLSGSVKLARVSNVPGARRATDRDLRTFKQSLENGTPEIRALFGPTLTEVEAKLASTRKAYDDYKGPRALGNEVADEVYGKYSGVVDGFNVANADAVTHIDDAELRNRATSIAQQTYTSDALSRLSRAAALTTLKGGITDDEMRAEVALFSRYHLARDQAIAMLSDDPAAQKVMAGFYNRSSIKAFDKAIDTFIKTKEVNPTKIIADAADVSHPNGTDAWIAARDSLQRRGDSLVSAAEASRNLNLVIFFVATGLSLALALLVARSISEPLISVADQSNRMATEVLPNAIRDVLATPVGQDIVPPPVAPIEVSSRDEVALVAGSLNDLQQRTLDLAVEQAGQRKNFADTFLSLGRRVQGLVGQQLDFITELEDSEQDPDTLANLFRLDHFATRIRRNAESMVVLAGVAEPRRGGEPTLVVDVLRSALSEVEDYARVGIGQVADARVAGSVAADLSHILAELIDNGLKFSDATARVDVSGVYDDAGYVIEITDRGVGMDAAQLALANRRLDGTESFTVAPSQYMGLYVAGHLAERIGASVSVESGPDGTGVVSKVTLGQEMVLRGTGFVEDEDAPKVPLDQSLGSLLSMHHKLSVREVGRSGAAGERGDAGQGLDTHDDAARQVGPPPAPRRSVPPPKQFGGA